MGKFDHDDGQLNKTLKRKRKTREERGPQKQREREKQARIGNPETKGLTQPCKKL